LTQRPVDDRDEVLELDGDTVVGAAAQEDDARGELRCDHARLCGERGIAHAVRNRLRGIREVDLDVIGPQVQPVMAAGDQRMIAHMGVNVERPLHPAAHVAIVAPAGFHHLVAQHGVGTR